jgi:membrane protein YdbS with pleckstrin-like domain
MIPIDSWQRLPSRAIWFGLLASLALALVLIGVAVLMQSSGSAGTLKCHGAPCSRMSGSLVAGFICLFAIYLVGRSVLHFKTFAFLLTDRTLTTVAGYFFQSSTTCRFDRIQDVDTVRGPIHAILGLKTVSVWTASPDQFVRGKRRPDARIVLDAENADWLRDYVSNPPTGTGGNSSAGSAVSPSALLQSAPRANVGLVLVLLIIAALGVPAVLLWKTTSISHPSASMTPATAPVGAARSAPSPRPLPIQQPAQSEVPAQAVPADYTIACAIHGSGDIDQVIPCAKFSEAQRCQHEADFPSNPTAAPAVLTVVNRSREPIRFYWLDRSGTRTLYASLPPGGHVSQQSHAGAHWLLSTRDDQCIAIFNAATMTIGIF